MQDKIFYSPNCPNLNRPKMFQTVPKCPNLLPNVPKIHIYPHKTQIDSESHHMYVNIQTCPKLPLNIPKCPKMSLISSFVP